MITPTFEELCSQVYDAYGQAFQASGQDPKEVWLGPTHARALLKHEGYSFGIPEHMGVRKGFQLMGMNVWFMMEEGVRVGTTWPKEP